MGRVIRGIGLVVAIVVLGALGGWWFLQTIEPQHLPTTIATLEGDIRETAQAQAQVRSENLHLKQENVSLQTSFAELSQRVALLEDSKRAPEVAVSDPDVDQLQGRVAALEDTKQALEADIRETSQANAQIRSENDRLQQDSVSLQASVGELGQRVAALEDTKTALEDTIGSMKKQLGASIPKRDYTRVVSERNRLVKSNVALRKNKKKREKVSPPAPAVAPEAETLQELAKDQLALLLVKFLIKYERQNRNWFDAPSIQAVESGQEEFALFQYHAWTTIDAKLRSMEGAKLVKGRDAGDPRGGRQFAIRHGTPLTTLQTLASN